MKFITSLLLFPIIGIAQQTITLNDCYQLSRENYPTIQKLDLLSKSEAYTLANANRAYLPQVSILGQATYQSEVTDLSKSVAGVLPLPPNISLPTIDKEQYKVVGEVSQLLYGGRAIRRKLVPKPRQRCKPKRSKRSCTTSSSALATSILGHFLSRHSCR